MKTDIKILILSIVVVILIGLNITTYTKLSNLHTNSTNAAKIINVKINKLKKDMIILENRIEQKSEQKMLKEMFKKFFNTFKDYIK